MSQTVFITGADKGLGLSLAKAFLKSGFQVFAGVYFSGEELHKIAAEFPGMLALIGLDVSDRSSVRRAAQEVSAAVSALDLLINNAGVNLEKPAQSLEELDFADGHIDRTMQVNAFGPLYVVQQFLPLLEQGAGKTIVNISSEAGSISDCTRKDEYAYCMSKAALNMASKILHNSLHPHGFTILTLHPGWMRTDMGGPQADLHPDEAAEAILLLATDKEHPAGETIYMNYRGEALPW